MIRYGGGENIFLKSARKERYSAMETTNNDPREEKWQSMLASLDLFTDDFLSEEIEPLPLEEREVLL